jgi:asparagine synthetase B (glutamine-hydrolysing)
VLASTLLQVRGTAASDQGRCPLVAPAAAANAQTILCFNGEIYEACPPELLPALAPKCSDGDALLDALNRCVSEQEAVAVLSALRGPWALACWHAPTRRLFFGRDVFGRRSLLAFRGGRRRGGVGEQVQFGLASVAPDNEGDGDGDGGWEEVPPGVWSLGFEDDEEANNPLGARAHPWSDPLLERLRQYERGGPGDEEARAQAQITAARLVLRLLLRAVSRCVRGTIDRCHERYPPDASDSTTNLLTPPSPVLVLFSGGVDSVLLAAATHRALLADEGTTTNSTTPIDLCNVCFDPERQSPDRLAAIDAYKSLKKWAPQRTWRLLLVDASLADADAASRRLRALMKPCATVMDLNIGAALWMAARGVGRVYCDEGEEEQGAAQPISTASSAARVVLLGHGADEQHGGYGRHLTSWRQGGSTPEQRLRALSRELELDVRRLWRRNLGRDDRLVADTGREARHPFLDEAFSLEGALELPTRVLVAHEEHSDDDYGDLPPDKRLLRLALLLLGCGEGDDEEGGDDDAPTPALLLSPGNPFASAARRAKRAIQFGTRLGKLCNVRDFGSNRRANARSAGSVALAALDGERRGNATTTTDGAS